MTDKKQPQQKVKVTLLKPHTHKGEPCAAGDKIDVNTRQKAWLVSQGVVAFDEPAAPDVKAISAKAKE
ncbi:DUF7210 family protein [Halopseudomonas aestusnigri]|uniref:DUF7210 domain-containing protein n=1 Tax=Halopseudomonas aestusnigri TaxID=857252 RepID=A0AAQ1GAD7_9GAMM|nr:hypothetical protein [Halopseudomonas aestusnigri]OWL84576.1 hypothetical protein B7O88_16130 [Halopseudomonas aestusnigri]SEG70368.1 hypothetical protein SAMN05216586_11664 [Halopseudomonas aestusnigri]